MDTDTDTAAVPLHPCADRAGELAAIEARLANMTTRGGSLATFSTLGARQDGAS